MDAAKGFGKISIHWRLRDWLISRQRYWGTPIPMIYCAVCGVVPCRIRSIAGGIAQGCADHRRRADLLWRKVRDFVECAMSQCGIPARRETDTMATFFDSSWYFLRFCSAHNQ